MKNPLAKILGLINLQKYFSGTFVGLTDVHVKVEKLKIQATLAAHGAQGGTE